MKRQLATGIVLALLVTAVPTSAGFLADPIDEGIYFVSYQRGQMLRGNVLFDREKKVRQRLERQSHEFCLAQGYRYLRFPTLGEIAEDDYLRAVWSVAAGDDSQNTSQVEGTQYALNHVHKSRALLLLSVDPREGYEPCRVWD